MENIEPLDEDFVLECLQESFDAEDLNDLIDDEFGKGLIMGQIHALAQFHLNKLVDEVLEDDEE